MIHNSQVCLHCVTHFLSLEMNNTLLFTNDYNTSICRCTSKSSLSDPLVKEASLSKSMEGFAPQQSPPQSMEWISRQHVPKQASSKYEVHVTNIEGSTNLNSSIVFKTGTRI